MIQTWMPHIGRLTQAIGWCLMHSFWQGAIIYFVMCAVFRAFPAMGSRLKHSCALMGLLLLTLWTGNTAITQWQQLQPMTVTVTPGAAATAYSLEIVPRTQGYSVALGSDMPRLEAIMPWLTLCYSLGLLAMLVRLGGGMRYLYNLRKRNTVLPNAALLEVLQSLQLQMGIAQRVALRISSRVAVPLVIGILRPVILLPSAMMETLSPEGLEAIILHELAHISRADFIINIFQATIETLLFFNPFVWRLSATIRREREHCCDDLVVAYISEPLAYARALASLADSQVKTGESLAIAATGHRPFLLDRIKRILEMKKQPLRYAQIIAACTVAALITVSIVWFTPSLAQQRKKDKQKAAEKKEVVANPVVPASQSSTVLQDTSATISRYVRKELTKEERAELANAQEAIRIAISNLDTIKVGATVAEAMKNVNWDEIHLQIDSALQQVAAIDWETMDKEIAAGLAEANRAMNDPTWKKELQHSMELMHKELANERVRNSNLRESRRTVEEARQNARQARRAVERAQRDLERAKEELKRLERER